MKKISHGGTKARREDVESLLPDIQPLMAFLPQSLLPIRETLSPESQMVEAASPPPATPPDFEGIRALAASLNALHRQMAAACAPSVQSIIQSRSRDHQHIEQLLDRLLNCACIPAGLALFRSLCRYYFTLNPAATATYIEAYRDMWDSDDTKELSGSTEKKTAK